MILNAQSYSSSVAFVAFANKSISLTNPHVYYMFSSLLEFSSISAHFSSESQVLAGRMNSHPFCPSRPQVCIPGHGGSHKLAEDMHGGFVKHF